MNYQAIHDSIIRNAVKRNLQKGDGYSERHHIVPRSFGGSNLSDNLIRLTLREQFIVHKLLVKMTTGAEKMKMACALWRMIHWRKDSNLKIGSREYQRCKEIFVEMMKGFRHSEESKRKISISLKGKATKCRPKTDEHKKKISESQKGKIISQETKRKLSERSKHQTEEHKRQVSENARKQLEKINANRTGKKYYHHPETLEKLVCIPGQQPEGYVNGFVPKQ